MRKSRIAVDHFLDILGAVPFVGHNKTTRQFAVRASTFIARHKPDYQRPFNAVGTDYPAAYCGALVKWFPAHRADMVFIGAYFTFPWLSLTVWYLFAITMPIMPPLALSAASYGQATASADARLEG